MTTLAERLRNAMHVAGVSQAQLARACNVKPPSVHGWLSGKSKFLRGENLLRAAKVLNVNESWLATGVGAMHQEIKGGMCEPSARHYFEPKITIETAIPLVLDAIRGCQNKDELRALLTLFIDHDAVAYRQRLTELLIQGAFHMPTSNASLSN